MGTVALALSQAWVAHEETLRARYEFDRAQRCESATVADYEMYHEVREQLDECRESCR